ncbi:LLM class flavin-dependent oxidoreductase [Candidatus Mycolicibacterium alkanivorans]|uniref:LLM class flavin-dependent oxidoreductase n=1 Tax=Candidatus Mycolicibacterium alkanivorans TaxID=2954114 RepID=A0ABS9YYY5_9MYCO|nr:LLM class flavin-dependent oxidoreductase [Candidatus Mycolicibacterium alkanivorans]MCI4675933.1 LLM class flavin-dependent oxidoreductase [Candidatus Mycolicibacterium alkanivorans]
MTAFFAASHNVTHYHGGWRHPEARHNFLSAEFYLDVARTLERGLFDLVFLPDCQAVEDRYGDSLEAGVGLGAQGAVFLDPITVLPLLAAETTKIGLGATISTTYCHPFAVARTLASLDHLSGGRAAWNIVTSLNASEARNYGLTSHLEHDARYARADEFVTVTEGLWRSWDPDALVLDRAAGVFADPTKVAYLNHQGEWFSVRGPLPLPHSPQGRPVIIQAGTSPQGRRFAARWADLVFVIAPNRSALKAIYDDIKTKAAEAGRDPDALRVIEAIIPIVGKTEAEAREKEQFLTSLVDPRAGLSSLSSHTDVDFSRFNLDDPMETVLSHIDSIGGSRGQFQLVLDATRTSGGTLADLGRQYGWVMVERFAGTADQIASRIAEYFTEPIVDGFAISPVALPATYREFVDHVVPALQEIGVFHRGYEDGATLRERLALPYVPVAAQAPV